MLRNRLTIALALTVQTAVTSVPVFAQDSPGYTPDVVSVEDVYSPSPSYTPDIIDVGDIYTPTPTNEVPTAQLPTGLGKVVLDILGDDNPNTINATQQKFLKAIEYGRKAREVYRLGKDLYNGVSKIIKNPDGLIKDTLASLLDNYDKIGGGTDAGGEGSTEKIFDPPTTPDESYLQAKNDVARRMFLPSLMSQLVFSEEARTLREQQSGQLEESLTNTIEAATNLVQLSGGTVEAVAHNGDLAKAVGEEASHAQSRKSSQAVLKSIAAANGIRAQQTATNGVVLGNIQQSQVEQNKSALALVVSSALAYQQRDVQNHQLASQSVFLEQIRADLGQQEDERQLKASAELEKQANITGNILIPGLAPAPPQADQ